MSNRLAGPLAWLLFPITATVMVFILAPLVVTVAISISDTAFVAFPPRGFTIRWYEKVLSDPEFLGSLAFSAGLALAATSGAMLLGVPAAFAVVRSRFPGRGAAATALLSPLVFPVLITGVALLQLFAMMGFNNTTLNLLIAHVLVTTPYVVRTVTASLMLADITLEEAAQTLGATAWRSFRRITLPLSLPGLAVGCTLVFSLTAGSFVTPAILGGSAAQMLGMLVDQQILVVYDWPFGATVATVLVAIVLTINIVSMRALDRDNRTAAA